MERTDKTTKVQIFNYWNESTKKPKDKNREFVFLSNGHTCPGLYSTLARFNFFKINSLVLSAFKNF